MSNNNNMSGKDFLIGALVGGIIGAGAALLLAPKSGKELRVDLTEGYHTATKKTQELAKSVGEKSEYIVGKVKEVASNVKEDIQNFASNTLKDANELKEEVQEEAAEGKEEVAAAQDSSEPKASK